MSLLRKTIVGKELVKEYVKTGFSSIDTIQEKDVDIIVDKYLHGTQSLAELAREEAKRIKQEARYVLDAHKMNEEIKERNKLIEQAKVRQAENEFQIERSLLRPPPRDANVPNGFEREGGMIRPIEKAKHELYAEIVEHKETQMAFVKQINTSLQIFSVIAVILFAVGFVLYVKGITSIQAMTGLSLMPVLFVSSLMISTKSLHKHMDEYHRAQEEEAKEKCKWS